YFASMRCTSAIAACAAARAPAASAAWTWISFSAAIARNAKRCSAIRKASEGAAHADDPIVRAQRDEGLAPTAAEPETARVLDVPDGAFHAPAVVELELRAKRRGKPAEGGEALVAREDRRLRPRNHRRVEIGL